MKNVIKDKLKPCPFCSFVPDRYDPDCIYPADRGKYNPETDKIEYEIWNINCYETGGGCGCYILGHSPEDCVKRWNNRK
jgi:hypothetical protein